MQDNEKSGHWRRLKALIIKEFYQIRRDPSSFLISLVLPILLLFLYGYGVSLDVDHIRLGLVLEDTSPIAQSFTQALSDSRYFDLTVVRDRRLLEEMMVAGKIRGIVVIPAYFSSFLNQPEQVAPIQVIADGSEPNTASFVQNYVQGAWSNWLQQRALETHSKGLPLVHSQPRVWYNEQLESRYFLVPGSLAIIMTLIGTLLTALVVSREWERGTMEALMATPVTISELLFGKLIPYFILGMITMTLVAAVATLYYDIPFRGSWWALGLVSAVFLLTALGIGLLISTIARNQFVAAQAAMIAAFLPGFILSGFIFEIASMPVPIRMITYLVPARYFVSSLQTLFLVGDIWELLLPNLFWMIVIGSVFYVFIAAKTAKRLD